MPKCDFNKAALLLKLLNLLHIFRTPFLKKISGWMLLDIFQSKTFTSESTSGTKWISDVDFQFIGDITKTFWAVKFT